MKQSTKPANNGKIWTTFDDSFLLQSVIDKKPISMIAGKLQRTQKACASRLHGKLMKRSGKHKEAVRRYLMKLDKNIFDLKLTENSIRKNWLKRFDRKLVWYQDGKAAWQ